jgi:hypothetical protein
MGVRLSRRPKIVAADANPKAAAVVSQLFDVTSLTLDRMLTEEIPSNSI